MSHELFKRYRPKTLKEVTGQPQAVAILEGLIAKKKIPHAILLTGPSGTGKTTIARILAREAGCLRNDYVEINAADKKGIEMAREIADTMRVCALGGGSRVWLLEECHKATGDCQSCLLRILEDPPDHAYFFLPTTDPQKLLPTLRSRCTEIALKPVPDKDIEARLMLVAKLEDFVLTKPLCEAIAEASLGSLRKALVTLESCMALPDDKSRLASVTQPGLEKHAIDVAKSLMDGDFAKVAKVLSALDKAEDVEGMRQLILSYHRKVLLGGGKFALQSAKVIQAMDQGFYGGANANAAIFALRCYEACQK